MARKFSLILVAALILLLLVQSVNAMSLAPPSYKLPYEPGTHHKLQFVVYDTPGKFIGVDAIGPFKEYITLSETSFVMGASGAHYFTAEFTMPELTKPGEYRTEIFVTESAPPGVSGVGATVALASLIKVRVPYPDKYADIKLEIGHIKAGELAHFVVKLFNYGIEMISRAGGNIEVFDSTNTTVATLTLSEAAEIAPNQDVQLVTDWDTTGTKLGEYRAVANVNYDEKSTSDEKTFKIGDILIEILNISVKEVQKDTIAKIPIEIESKWSEPIMNVYGIVHVSRERLGIADVTTASVNVQPWSRATLEAYWSTTDLDEGIYDALVTVYYSNKTAESNTHIKIVSKEVFAFNSEFLFIIVLVVLVFLLAIAYYKKRKRKRRYYWYY